MVGGASHAFLWQNGKLTDLSTLGGKQSQAVAINDTGDIIGWSDTKATNRFGDQINHAFAWQKGRLTDLGTLAGGQSEPVALNDHGQIVGSGTTESGETHAVLWTLRPGS